MDIMLLAKCLLSNQYMGATDIIVIGTRCDLRSPSDRSRPNSRPSQRSCCIKVFIMSGLLKARPTCRAFPALVTHGRGACHPPILSVLHFLLSDMDVFTQWRAVPVKTR